MQQYHDCLRHIIANGEDVGDRTGTGTRSVFGYQMRFNLQDGFPAVTTKRLAWKSVVSELLWFLEGSTDERRLAELTFGKPRDQITSKATIWTANADNQGVALGYVNDDTNKYLGPVYGSQWRSFGDEDDGSDQISWLVNEIKNNPESRRLIMSSWSPNQIHLMALPPCHVLAQFRVMNGKLSCQMYQRSADMFLGVPFNIASYALLTHIIARECELEVGDFIHTIGDAHVYSNHFEQVEEQLSRTEFDLPTLEIDPGFDMFGMDYDGNYPLNFGDNFTLKNYEYHATIKAKMAI